MEGTGYGDGLKRGGWENGNFTVQRILAAA
jgi:hypothetical protein